MWRNDPVAFENYPSFFLAHEIAHQWWGQAVGWKNYHEQWLSEGFAQYFAALYAERERGAGAVRQRDPPDAAVGDRHVAAGPGLPRLPPRHIKGDGRVFRALVYNKGAMVLHMLRRLVGDEAFFAGLRDFYAKRRYKKAGTDDFQVAMEKAAGGRSSDSSTAGFTGATSRPSGSACSKWTCRRRRVRLEQTRRTCSTSR